jgi:hypothetical protein
MTENNGIRALTPDTGGQRLLWHRQIYDMVHQNASGSHLHPFTLLQLKIIVGIPQNGCDRSHLLQLQENAGAPNVPGMDDMRDTTKKRWNLGVQVIMGI